MLSTESNHLYLYTLTFHRGRSVRSSHKYIYAASHNARDVATSIGHHDRCGFLHYTNLYHARGVRRTQDPSDHSFQPLYYMRIKRIRRTHDHKHVSGAFEREVFLYEKAILSILYLSVVAAGQNKLRDSVIHLSKNFFQYSPC